MGHCYSTQPPCGITSLPVPVSVPVPVTSRADGGIERVGPRHTGLTGSCYDEQVKIPRTKDLLVALHVRLQDSPR
jgi:hypothetical protein